MCNSFFHLLPTVFCSAVVLGAFLCTAAATNSGATSGLRTVRPPCKLKWVCDHILSKDKPRRKDKLKTFWQTLTFQLDLTLISYKEDRIVQFCGVREQHQWLTYQGGCLFLKFLNQVIAIFQSKLHWKLLKGPFWARRIDFALFHGIPVCLCLLPFWNWATDMLDLLPFPYSNL